jgi:predicted amidophosphoribosyltransferase
MNLDEPDYFCARCYGKLPTWNTEALSCEWCGNAFVGERDYMTAEQLHAKKVEDDKRWSEAEASGLILPPRAGG